MTLLHYIVHRAACHRAILMPLFSNPSPVHYIGNAMGLYIVLYRFTKPGDKAAGPVQQYRLYARDLRQAWEMAREYGNYPGIQIIDILTA